MCSSRRSHVGRRLARPRAVARAQEPDARQQHRQAAAVGAEAELGEARRGARLVLRRRRPSRPRRRRSGRGSRARRARPTGCRRSPRGRRPPAGAARAGPEPESQRATPRATCASAYQLVPGAPLEPRRQLRVLAHAATPSGATVARSSACDERSEAAPSGEGASSHGRARRLAPALAQLAGVERRVDPAGRERERLVRQDLPVGERLAASAAPSRPGRGSTSPARPRRRGRRRRVTSPAASRWWTAASGTSASAYQRRDRRCSSSRQPGMPPLELVLRASRRRGGGSGSAAVVAQRDDEQLLAGDAGEQLPGVRPARSRARTDAGVSSVQHRGAQQELLDVRRLRVEHLGA